MQILALEIETKVQQWLRVTNVIKVRSNENLIADHAYAEN